MNKKGFTLIEIMVVIVIMGILAAVAVPKLFGSVAKAKASEIAPAAGTYIKLQDLYIAEKGSVGNWNSIGYVAPGSGTTNNFTYCGGEIETDIEVDKFGDAAKVGWQATNKTSLNDCSAGHWWFVFLKPESSSNVIYTNETNASECVALATPKWDVSNRTGVACGVAGNSTQETEVAANKSVMTPENVKVTSGAWCGGVGQSAHCNNTNLKNRLMVTNSESESGLFEMEPNSTYEFKISAGAAQSDAEGITANNFDIGTSIYEDGSGKSDVVSNMGWLKGQSGKEVDKGGGYTAQVTYEASTNSYVVTINTGDKAAYMGVNVKVSTNHDFTDAEKEAINKAAKAATLTKVTEETTAGSSSSKQ